jgi:hypothetical protein
MGLSKTASLDPIGVHDNVAIVGRIYEEHGGFIRAVIRQRAVNPDEEQELYQDLFLELVAKPPNSIGNIKAYIGLAEQGSLVCFRVNRDAQAAAATMLGVRVVSLGLLD